MALERIGNIGSSPIPGDSERSHQVAVSFEKEITGYVAAFLHINHKNLDAQLPNLATRTIDLNQEAQKATATSSVKLKDAGEGVEKILANPHLIPGLDKQVSLLDASKIYLPNPSSPELKKVLETFLQHTAALEAMLQEFRLLAQDLT
jgi:hypothetical protein